jgi:site-specific DNA-methyltransferase (adenine-specific)
MMNITNEDNMELMARYPDNYFDLAIVDPPYGIGCDAIGMSNRASNSKKFKGYKGKQFLGGQWDKKPEEVEYFEELKRVSKNQIIWGANHFIENISNANSSCWIVWRKNGQNPNATNADCELAYTSFKTAVRFFNYDWSGFGFINKGEDKIHPTQKPVALYKWLLDKYAKQGDKILDTHLGSGSIAIACHDYKFDLTACELDKEYFDKAMQRINNHTAQQKLF